MNKRHKKLKSSNIALPEYGLGSWMKDHAGVIGTVAGMGAGIGAIALTGGLAAPAVVPGMAAAAGGAGLMTGLSGALAAGTIGSTIGGQVGGAIQQNKAQSDMEASQNQQNDHNSKLQSFNAQLKPQSSNIPTFRNGGIINYDGQTHDGPDGGIPIDNNGNPSAQSGNQPTGLTEDKEVAWKLPDGNTFIFSDSLGYAPVAKRIYSKYSKRLGKNMEKTDPISMKGLAQEFDDLAAEQEMSKQMSEKNNKQESSNRNNMRMYQSGGTEEVVTPVRPASANTQSLTNAQIYAPKNFPDSLARVANVIDSRAFHDKQTGRINSPDNAEVQFAIKQTKATRELMQRFVNNNSPAFTGDRNVTIPNSDGTIGINYGRFMNKYAPAPEHYGMAGSSGVTPRKDIVDFSDIFKNGGMLPKYTDGGYSFDPLLSDDFGSAPSSPGVYNTAPEMYKGSNTMDFIGAGASMLGNAIQMVGTKKPSPIRLGRITPKTIDLGAARTAMQDESRNTKVNLMRGLPQDASYRANALKGVSDINSNLNKNMLGSYTQEAETNAGITNQANAQNAEMQSQEALINAQRGEGYQNTQNAYKKAMMQAPIDAMSKAASREDMWDMAQLNENYDIVKNPKTGRIQFIPKKK